MKSEGYNVREIEIDIYRYLVTLKKRWWIILLSCFVLGDVALLVYFFTTPEYQSSATLLFESARQTSSLIGLDDAPKDLRALTGRDDPLDTQVQILRSIPLAEKVVSELQLVDDSGNLLKPQALLSDLEVGGIPGTDVLKISFTSDTPKLSTTVVDRVMKVFIAQNVATNRSAAKAAQNFIENQLPTTESKVSKAEDLIKQFKERYNIVDFEGESQRVVNTLSELENNLTQLQSQFANLNSQSVTIQRRINLSDKQAYDSGIISQSPAVEEVLTQLHTAESELVSGLSQYEENNPIILNLRDRISNLKQLLNQRAGGALNSDSSIAISPSSGNIQSGDLKQGLIERSLQIDTEKAGLLEQIQELSLVKAHYQNRAQTLPSLEKQYLDLDRKRNAAKITHERLLEKLQEAKVLQNQSIGNARVVSPAQLPTQPLGFSKPIYFLGGASIGLIIGIIIAFLTDLIDQIHSVEEIQLLYNYPLLGIIEDSNLMYSPSDISTEFPNQIHSPLLSNSNLNSYAEIQSMLKSRYRGQLPRILGITSAVEGEGKSTITANFAIALSHLGYTVLVIDAHFKRPFQHHIWSIYNRLGLSDLAASKTTIADSIHRIKPRLDVLTAGNSLRTSASNLNSPALSDIIHRFQDLYDIVLVDAPSISSKTNITSIRSVKHLLVVMQADLLNKSDIRKARKILSNHKHLDFLGLVANKVRPQPTDSDSKLFPMNEKNMFVLDS